MKNTLLMLTALLLMVVSAQETKSKAEFLTSTVWKIKNETMSGVGTHNSLQKDTELTFSADGNGNHLIPLKEIQRDMESIRQDPYHDLLL